MLNPGLAAIVALVASMAFPAIAGDASGEFTAGTRQPIRPKFAAAFEDRDTRNPREKVIAVVLSDAPVNVAAALDELDPHMAIINQDALRDRNYVLLWVRPGNDVSMNATYSEKMTQFIDRTPDSLKAEVTENTPDRVAGHVFTPKPVKTMDGEIYAANLTFSATIVHAPASTKLPADGGEAGKAFNALMAAIEKKSWAGISQNVTERNLKSFTDADRTAAQNLAEALQMLGFWLPKKAGKITGGELRGDVAILEVEADMFGTQKGLYLVRMVKVGPRWVFDRARNAGLIG